MTSPFAETFQEPAVAADANVNVLIKQNRMFGLANVKLEFVTERQDALLRRVAQVLADTASADAALQLLRLEGYIP